MIWHVLEVWLLLGVMFALGCVLGATAYGVIGGSALSATQGVVADSVGDLVDAVKARVGMGPAWRPGRLRNFDRPVPPPRIEPSAPPLERVAGPESESVPALSSIDVESPSAITAESMSLQVTTSVPRSGGDEVPDPVGDPVGDVGRAEHAMRVADDGIVPKRPPGLNAPRGGAPDNLQRIKGVGRRNETLLNELGIYHFGQLAAWTPAEIRWIGQYLAFPERIERDDWSGQAMLLAMGTDTGFEKSADRRRRKRRDQRDFAERMATAGQPDESLTEDSELFAEEGEILEEFAVAEDDGLPDGLAGEDDDALVLDGEILDDDSDEITDERDRD